MAKLLFCYQSNEGISFKVLFLVNMILHKGIVNPHQMTVEFFFAKKASKSINMLQINFCELLLWMSACIILWIGTHNYAPFIVTTSSSSIFVLVETRSIVEAQELQVL